MSLTIKVETQPTITVVRLTGELTAPSHGVLTGSLKPLLEGGQPRVILDVTAVSFITSVGLGELVRVVAQANSVGGRVVLAGPTPFVADVLETTKLDKFFEICESVDAALHRLG